MRSGTHVACGAPRRSHHAIRAARREARGWRGAYFSQPIFEPDRSLCSPHIRRGMLNVGTIGDFSRKMARPAGFEPATPGLEGRISVLLSGIRRNKAEQKTGLCAVWLFCHTVCKSVFRDASGHGKRWIGPSRHAPGRETSDSGAAAGDRRHPWPCAWRGGTGWRVRPRRRDRASVGRRWGLTSGGAAGTRKRTRLTESCSRSLPAYEPS